jgi:hypothetical protein
LVGRKISKTQFQTRLHDQDVVAIEFEMHLVHIQLSVSPILIISLDAQQASYPQTFGLPCTASDKNPLQSTRAS